MTMLILAHHEIGIMRSIFTNSAISAWLHGARHQCHYILKEQQRDLALAGEPHAMKEQS